MVDIGDDAFTPAVDAAVQLNELIGREVAKSGKIDFI